MSLSLLITETILAASPSAHCTWCDLYELIILFETVGLIGVWFAWGADLRIQRWVGHRPTGRKS